jgi:hypothetical protein
VDRSHGCACVRRTLRATRGKIRVVSPATTAIAEATGRDRWHDLLCHLAATMRCDEASKQGPALVVAVPLLTVWGTNFSIIKPSRAGKPSFVKGRAVPRGPRVDEQFVRVDKMQPI